MPKINLLPWRSELRKQRQREFLTSLGLAALAGAAVWFGIRAYIGDLTEYQNRRNAFLKDQIALMDKQIEEIQELEKEKERLLARMRAIETLQASRPVIVRLFDEIVTTLPEGVFLTELSQKDKQVTIKGVASSNARVSNLMRNIEGSTWVTNPRLQIIENERQEGERVATFTLVFDQKDPVPPPEEQATAEAGPAS